MNKLNLLLLSFFLFGCAMASSIQRVSLGMTKKDVIEVMGTPDSVSAKDGVEYLKYQLAESQTLQVQEYFVRIVDGKVNAYGRTGDFDSSNPSLTIDATIKNR